MHIILLINKWTDRTIIYPIHFSSKEEADLELKNSISAKLYSHKNWNYKVLSVSAP